MTYTEKSAKKHLFSLLKNERRKHSHIKLCILPDGITATVHSSEGPQRTTSRATNGRAGAVSVLKELVKEWDISGADTHLVLDSSDYQLSLIERPSVEEHELNDALGWTVSDRLSTPAQATSVRWFHLPRSALDSSNQIYVATTAKAVLHALADIVRQAGLTLKSIALEELSLASVLQQSKTAATAGMLTMEGEKAVFVMVTGDEFLLSRRLDISSGNDSEDTREQLMQCMSGAIKFAEARFGILTDEIWIAPSQTDTPLVDTASAYLSAPVKPLTLRPETATLEITEATPSMLATLQAQNCSAPRATNQGVAA